MYIHISIVASAIRVENWENFYNAVTPNMVGLEIEVIFVGDRKPTFELPSNFTWVESTVKPSQCYEIGFRRAKGELIAWTADDVHYSLGALAKAYSCYKMNGHEKTIIAFNCIEDGSYTSEGHRIGGEDTPMMAPIGLMNRDFFTRLGGYDKNFICGQAENDLLMRAYLDNAEYKLCETAIVEINHKQIHRDKSKFRSEEGYPYHKHDRAVIKNKWLSGQPNNFEPYRQKYIENYTQGPRGEWI